MSREWTLTINAPDKWITANPRRNNIHARAALVRAWRQTAYEYAQAATLPIGLDYVRIDALVRFKGRPPVRDRDNLRPTIKAVIDGLAKPTKRVRNGVTRTLPGYGLIADDDDKHLAGTDITIGDPLPNLPYGPTGQLILTILEIAR